VNTVIAIVVSLVAALLFAVGFVMQQREAAEVPDEDALGIGLITRLIRRPVWLIGTASDGLGYVAQAIALAFGSLVLVQPLLAASLLFALPLGAWWAKRRLKRSDGLWALVLTAGLAAFLIAGNPTAGVDSADAEVWLIAAAVIVPAAAACVIVASRRPKGALRSVLLGTATGILYGVAAALTKSVMSYLDDGFVDVIASWELYALIVAITLGTYLQQSSFQAGSLAQSLPAISVVEPVVAVAIGMTVLEEDLQAGGLEWGLIAVSAVAMILGTFSLARSQGESAPATPEPAAGPATAPAAT
jgi:drug/metabolite transporter (DMT)-like permease